MANWSSMMPAPGSEAKSPTRLRATPIGDADFDGLAFFLSGAGLPIGALKEPGRVCYRVEAENLVGYGGMEGEAERAGVAPLPRQNGSAVCTGRVCSCG